MGSRRGGVGEVELDRQERGAEADDHVVWYGSKRGRKRRLRGGAAVATRTPAMMATATGACAGGG